MRHVVEKSLNTNMESFCPTVQSHILTYIYVFNNIAFHFLWYAAVAVRICRKWLKCCILLFYLPDQTRRHLLSDPWPPSYGRWAPRLSSPPEGLWCWPGWFQSPRSPPSAPETSPWSRQGKPPTPSGSWGMPSDTAKPRDGLGRQGVCVYVW